MRPKNTHKTALRRKGTQGETLVPPAAWTEREAHPNGGDVGDPRHPEQHRAGEGRRLALGAKAGGLTAHTTA